MRDGEISQITRIGTLMIGVSVIFIALIGRLYYLQVIRAPSLKAESAKSRTYYLPLPPTRGLILDRNERPLAMNGKKYTVVVDKVHIQSSTEPLPVLVQKIGRVLDLKQTEMDKLAAAMQSSEVQGREVKHNVSEEEKDRIEKERIPGIVIKDKPFRFYPEGTLASHLIGFTGADNKGLSGVEYAFNSKIEGPSAVVITAEKDNSRNLLASADYTKIITRGADIVLTIDSYIQYVVERELKKVCEECDAEYANAVVLHPKTGDVLAFANYPTYDPNSYSDYPETFRKNRLLTDVYEPGSVLKPFILTAALDKKVVTPATVINCENGSYEFRGRTIRDDIHHFQDLTVHDVLIRSSNIGMVKISLRLGSSPDDFRGQAAVLHDYLKRFGFKNSGDGATSDLPGESPGILRPPSDWLPSSIGSIPYGQEIATNSLALAAAYSAIANRGMYKKPNVIKGYRGMDGIFYPKEPVPAYRIVSRETMEQLIKIMVDVTENPEGTGAKVRIPGFHLACKTGTAQKRDPKTGLYGKGMRVASFAGFFPSEDPQAVIVVMVDEPKKKKYGGEVSGPVFKTIAEELIAYWGLSPTYRDDALLVSVKKPSVAANDKNNKDGSGFPPTSPVKTQMSDKTRVLPIPSHREWNRKEGVMPDLTGMTMREAYAALTLNGLKAKFQGSGKVVRQEIPSGTLLKHQKKVGVVQFEPALTDPTIHEATAYLVQR